MRETPTLLVDRSALFREGLSNLLMKGGFLVAAMASSVEEIEAGDPLSPVPQLVIIGTNDDDIWLEKTIRALRARFCDAQIVVLADQYDRDLVQIAFRYSARAYLMKTIDCSTLIKSLELIRLGELELVMHGQSIFHSAISTHVECEPDLELEAEDDIIMGELPMSHASRRLSARETQILQCLVHGQSNKVIARNLDIVEATVKVHIKAILRKIRVQNRTQAAIWAVTRLDPVPGIIGSSGAAYGPGRVHMAP